ncbi:Uncharacterized membrane protein YesL [Lachnospiraceae bacterium NE2001]|nr:Uncharacterized membrane protein YesL [Lachnospiraceae bacterium NE2001]
MDVFRYDSDLMQAIGRAADLAWLNILCAICSIPIFTAGAAISAKYYVAMKLERGQAPGVTKTFFRAFKDNFVQDLKITFILLLIIGFFAVDWYVIIRPGAGSPNPIVIGMLAMFTAMVLVMGFCIFPMISRFEMKTFDSFRNALVFGIIHLPRVILGILMAVIPFVISIWYYKWAWLIWLFVASVALYYNSKFFIKTFDKLEERTFGPKEEPEEDPDYVLPEDETEAESDDKAKKDTETETDDIADNESENESGAEPDEESEDSSEETEEN